MISLKIPKFDSLGKKSGTVEIKTRYDKLESNHNLLHQVINAYLANSRFAISHTKTRAEVSGTGKKPHRQKGTGSARAGSLRNPVHIGGGVAFGPRKNHNFKKTLTKNMRLKALALALNEKNINNELFAVNIIKIEKIKTKDALVKIAKIPFKDGNILIVPEKYDKNLYLSYNNVPYAKVTPANELNALNLLSFDNILLTGNSHITLSQMLSRKTQNGAETTQDNTEKSVKSVESKSVKTSIKKSVKSEIKKAK